MKPLRALRPGGLLVLAAALLVPTGGCYQGPPRGGYAAQGQRVSLFDTTQWVRVQPPGTGFRCAMPGQPRIEVEERTDFDGTPQHATVGKLEVVGTALFGFAVVHSENGIAPNPMRQAQREASRDEEAEVIRSSRTYRRDGFPVNDAVLELPEEEATVFMRVVMGKSRLFTAFVGVASGSEDRMRPMIDGFFDSLRFDAREAPSPAGDGLIGDSWTFIYPPEADFAVMMPGEASFDEQDRRIGEEDLPVLTYQVRSEDDRFSFSVQAMLYAERPPAGTMEAARDAIVAAGMRLRSERDIHSQGFAGRALVFESDTQVLYVRHFVTNARLYTVAARLPKDREEVYRAHLGRFFSSFRIL